MVPIILTAVYDTLIFIAISYRMISLSMLDGPWSTRVKSFFTGNGLHHLSKAMLQSGQVYYLSVAICSILTGKYQSELVLQHHYRGGYCFNSPHTRTLRSK